MSELKTEIGYLKVEVHCRDTAIGPNNGTIYCRITSSDNNNVYLEEDELDEIKRLMRELKRVSSRR